MEWRSYGPAAYICSVIAEVNRDEDQRPEPYQPSDFMPKRDSDEELPQMDEGDLVTMLTTMFGAVDMRNNNG